MYTYVHEENDSLQNFVENVHLVAKHNSNPRSTYRLGLHAYSDLSPSMIKSTLNGLRYSDQQRSRSRRMFRRDAFVKENETNRVVNIDYRKRGVVTAVKDQGHCGSCYSFAATGALEAAYALAGHNLPVLSEQQILDCSSAWGNNGCNGGLMDFCFQYVIDNRGIDSEQSYPYETMEDLCRFNRTNVAANCVSFVDILPEGDEDALLQALKKHGPIAIGIDASSPEFMFYRSGVYRDEECSPEALDHGVLIVGAGVEKTFVNGTEVSEPYWLVKNSWGPTWGDEGYIKMARNRNNMCGVATAASFPLAQCTF
ncbi:hypothetical protein ACOME3_006015 [Neoechinorhynchus agilis]